MNMFRIIYLLLIWISLVNNTAVYAQETSEFSQTNQIKVLSVKTLSQTPQLTNSVNEIALLPEKSWQHISSLPKATLPLNAGENWFSIRLYNTQPVGVLSYLTLTNRVRLSTVHLYVLNQHKELQEVPIKLNNTHYWVANRNISAIEPADFYLKINADVAINVDFNVMTANQYLEQHSKANYKHGFFVSGLLFTAVVFFIFFVATRSKTQGILALYFLFRALGLAVLLGSSLFYFFPEHSGLRAFELPILLGIGSAFYLWFTCALFQIKKCAPQLCTWLQRLAFTYFFYALLSILLPIDVNIVIGSFILIFTLTVLTFVGFYMRQRNERLALSFAIVMIIQLLFAVVITFSSYLGFLVLEKQSDVYIISYVLNALLITYIISRQYYYHLLDKQKVQKEALANAIATKNAQDKILELQEQSQEDLEQRVQERTLELNIALNELEELNRELEEKNTMDELTGLYNRRFYEQKVLAEYRRSKRNLTSLSLLIIDIDYFKQVNDTFGHLAGDQCLSWLAQHIKQALKRSTDIGCRYGGEEFCLILPDTDTEGAVALAESIRVTVESFDFVYQDKHIPLTISCGVSTYQQEDDLLPEHIFFAADKALYNAKRAGRNQVKSFSITKQLIIQEQPNE